MKAHRNSPGLMVVTLVAAFVFVGGVPPAFGQFTPEDIVAWRARGKQGGRILTVSADGATDYPGVAPAGISTVVGQPRDQDSGLSPQGGDATLGRATVACHGSLPGAGYSTLSWPIGEFVSHRLDTGLLGNPDEADRVVFTTVVTVENAAWVRLYFRTVTLEVGSVIRMTSAFDGEVQELDAAGIAMWKNTSAYFNGDTVFLELVAAPGTSQNQMVLDRAAVYLPTEGRGPCASDNCGICGGDDRVPSNELWAGRIMPVGCTGTVCCPSSVVLSAGHCAADNNDAVIQFNVPSSAPNCAPFNPPVADQFPITTHVFVNGGIGNDWAVMTVGVNNLLEMPYDRYGYYMPVWYFVGGPGDGVSVSGYGVDNAHPTHSQTQQTSNGTIGATYSTYYTYDVDVTYGNSGSGLIHDDTLIGVVTHCSFDCANIATRADLAPFADVWWQLCHDGETITTPNTPSGPTSLQVNESGTYTTGGSTNNFGHPIEYRFDWGDSEYSTWGSATRSYSWPSAGTYSVRAQARCAAHPLLVSDWSESLYVNVSDGQPPVLTNYDGWPDGVDPDQGGPDTTFTFKVHYYDPEGTAPSVAQVVIDGQAHAMTGGGSGTDYSYSCTGAEMGGGTHSYHFYFEDGTHLGARLPTAGDWQVTVTASGGLAAHWPFDECSGTIAHDQSGNGHDAGIGGATWVPTGVCGCALEFNGVNAYVQCPDSPGFHIGGALTVSAWIASTGTSGDQFIVFKGSGWEYGTSWYTYVSPSGHFCVVRYYGNGSNANYAAVNSSNTVTDGEWHHVVGVDDGTSLKVYVDAIERGATNVPGLTPYMESDPLTIGRLGQRNLEYFDGTIDEIRIYDRALDTTEIQSLYAGCTPSICLSDSTLTNSCPAGQNAPTQTFEIWNCGDGTLNYAVTDDATWLWCDPNSGTSSGEHDSITVHYGSAGLAPGTYTATITISDPAAGNNPQRIAVNLDVGGLNVVWVDNFDDGSMSDWFIENPYCTGDNAIVLGVSTEQQVSGSYGLKVSGPSAAHYGGRATGPSVPIDPNQPFTIWFTFRWGSVHWFYMLDFGSASLMIDYASSKLRMSGQYIGPAFNSYCPANTWTRFRVEVDPPVGTYAVYANDTYIGSAPWGGSGGPAGFQFTEVGCSSYYDYLTNGYYDNVAITQGTSPDCNANGTPDPLDIAFGTSLDLNGDGIPDECELHPGDLNCDGSVDFGDINPFVLALTNPAAWQAAYPDCPMLNGDISGDGSVDFGDINPFVALLSGGG
jgi:hypothetical protein